VRGCGSRSTVQPTLSLISSTPRHGGQELDVLNPALASWRVDAAEALSALGDRASARRHADEHLALAERLGLPGPLGAGLRALARSARP
jgi:hypothetical protein